MAIDLVPNVRERHEAGRYRRALMSFTVAALVVGLVLGFVTGGRIANFGRRTLELVWLLALSALLQVAAETLDISDTAGLALVLVSYVGLAAFAVANIRLVGMPVVLVGLLCNLVVITLNSGMPVREDAILASHAATAEEVDALDFGAKRHLEDGDDVLTFLADIIPVRPTKEVLSFGDLILAVGIADVLFRLLKPVEVRGRREGDDVVDLSAHGMTVVPARQLVDA
jgi:hypothetical protein